MNLKSLQVHRQKYSVWLTFMFLVEICPGLHDSKMYATHEKHNKVSSFAFLLLPGWDAVHHRLPPPPRIKFAGTHLYTRVESGTLRVKCLAQEHDTMSLVKAQTQSACSGGKRANHEATTPPGQI